MEAPFQLCRRGAGRMPSRLCGGQSESNLTILPKERYPITIYLSIAFFTQFLHILFIIKNKLYTVKAP